MRERFALVAALIAIPVGASAVTPVTETFPFTAVDTFTLEPQTSDDRYYVASFGQIPDPFYPEYLVQGIAGTTAVSTNQAGALFQLGRSNLAWMPLYSVTLSSDQPGPIKVDIGSSVYEVNGPTTIVLDAKPQTSWQFIPEDSGVKLTLVSFIGNDSPVPEPATWAMMLLGFAGIGGVMRRRVLA